MAARGIAFAFWASIALFWMPVSLLVWELWLR